MGLFIEVLCLRGSRQKTANFTVTSWLRMRCCDLNSLNMELIDKLVHLSPFCTGRIFVVPTRKDPRTFCFVFRPDGVTLFAPTFLKAVDFSGAQHRLCLCTIQLHVYILSVQHHFNLVRLNLKSPPFVVTDTQ